MSMNLLAFAIAHIYTSIYVNECLLPFAFHLIYCDISIGMLTSMPFLIPCISLNCLAGCHSTDTHTDIYSILVCNTLAPVPTYILWVYWLIITSTMWVHWLVIASAILAHRLLLLLPYELMVLLLLLPRAHTHICSISYLLTTMIMLCILR